MKIENFFKEWYEAFAYSVSKDIMDKHVLALGNSHGTFLHGEKLKQ
jgi:hypothetical protein